MEKRTFVDKTSTKTEGGKALEDKVDYLTGQGTPHPVDKLRDEIRGEFLSFGFDEVELTYFLPEEILLKVYGDLFPLYEDLSYYLAWLKHKPYSESQQKPEEMKNEYWENLQSIIWEVKEENLSLEESVYRVMEEMGMEFQVALNLMLSYWRDVRGEITPQRLTLRSTMPAAWITTLRALSSEEGMPLKLFTVSPLFRREHMIQETHSRTFHILSAVVIDPGIDIDAGITVVRTALEKLDVKNAEFRYKHYTPPYYQAGKEYELFQKGMEVGTCGMLKPSLLKQSGIHTPVFHLEIGLERLLMVRDGYPDIKGLLYPQLYRHWKLSDKEIAEGIKPIKSPYTDWGRDLAQRVYGAFEEGKAKKKGTLLVLKDYVWVRGNEIKSTKEGGEGIRLISVYAGGALNEKEILGPASSDRIIISDGDIIGIPLSEVKKAVKKEGAIDTDINYVWPLSLKAAYKVEKWVRNSVEKEEMLVERVRSLEDVNLTLEPYVKEFILSRGKRVEVMGPLFFRVFFKGEVGR